MKTWRISEVNISAPPKGLVVIINFGDKGIHEVLLEEAASYIKTTKDLVDLVPVEITLTDKRQVGAFPCIVAKTELAANALGLLVGYDIAVGDGVRCATQLQARKRLERLKGYYGIPMKNLDCRWMVSPPKPAVQPTAPKPKQEFVLEPLPF